MLDKRNFELSDYIDGSFNQPTHHMSEIKLEIKIQNKKPVDLLHLTDSLLSLANEYKRFLHDKGGKIKPESRLYVKEIRQGSIVIDLIDMLPIAIAFTENVSTIIGYAEFLKKAFDHDGGSIGVLGALFEMNSQSLIVNSIP